MVFVNRCSEHNHAVGRVAGVQSTLETSWWLQHTHTLPSLVTSPSWRLTCYSLSQRPWHHTGASLSPLLIWHHCLVAFGQRWFLTDVAVLTYCLGKKAKEQAPYRAEESHYHSLTHNGRILTKAKHRGANSWSYSVNQGHRQDSWFLMVWETRAPGGNHTTQSGRTCKLHTAGLWTTANVKLVSLVKSFLSHSFESTRDITFLS